MPPYAGGGTGYQGGAMSAMFIARLSARRRRAVTGSRRAGRAAERRPQAFTPCWYLHWLARVLASDLPDQSFASVERPPDECRTQITTEMRGERLDHLVGFIRCTPAGDP